MVDSTNNILENWVGDINILNIIGNVNINLLYAIHYSTASILT